MASVPRPAQNPAWVLGLCVAAHTLLSIDRGVMGILAEPIKRAFDLTDSQLGLLTGIGFSLFFGIGGIPIGMLVDRASRKHILAASVFVFSGMTTLAAVTGSFIQILLARSIVGAGEAGGTPSMGSILADLYPPERRAQAMAIFYAGNPLGAILAFLVGGTIAAHYGWRATFLAAGIPGLILAALLLLFVREPVRRADSGVADGEAAPTLGETLRFVGGQRALRHILFTPVLTSAASAGIFSFAASFFLRSHGLTLPQVGLLLAVFYGTLGAIGTVVCGRLVDRLARRDERWRAWFCAIANANAAIAVPIMTLSPGFPLAVLGLGLYAVATTATYGPLLAMLQSLVTSRMRGTVTAIFYLLSYLLGAASGPFIVGHVSDALKPQYGTDSLRYGMLLMGLLYTWGALHFLLAARRYRHDLAIAATRI
jgi:predicted MFS family arabinose efflux permease